MASILNDEIHEGKEVVRKKFSFGDQQLILRSTIPDKAADNLISADVSKQSCDILKYKTVIRGTYVLRSILGIEKCLKTLVLLNS